ncbi:MAG: hypothetical protein E6K64_05195 [Nitrospirae bacterium]|nr:MAG: hypothetical protein E6K64_05195 [Nitrospirota bacterium]
MDRRAVPALIGGCCLLLAGCASSRRDAIQLEYQLPPELQSQVEQRVSFANVKADPASYKGRIILLGGEVLEAKRLADRTKLEILHLPLNEFNEPVMNRTASQGRYLAFQKEFLDPATVPPGTRVTVVGEVTGLTEGDLDEMKYSYVTLEIRHLQIWPQTSAPYARGSPYTPFYSYAYLYRYWDPYWSFYWEPYWSYPYGFGGSFLRPRLRGSHPLSAMGHSHTHASGSKGGKGK